MWRKNQLGLYMSVLIPVAVLAIIMKIVEVLGLVMVLGFLNRLEIALP